MYFLYDQNDDRIKASHKSLYNVPLNGSRFLYIPDSIRVNAKDNNFDRDTLITKKWAGLSSESSFFSYIIAESLLDDSAWDLGNSDLYGLGSSTWIRGSSTGGTPPVLQTNEYDLSGDFNFNESVLGEFRLFKVYWEVYSLVRVENQGRYEVMYQSLLPDAVNVSLSVNGGVDWGTVGFMELINADITSSVMLKFESEANAPVPTYALPGTEPAPTPEPAATADRYYIGSFAIIY